MPSRQLSATILVVEDDDAVRNVVTAVLRRHGATVHEATNLMSAQQVAALLDRIDLLLTDVVLPDGSGLRLPDLLRAWHPDLRVLVMSGYIPDQVVGVDAPFLQKPFGPSTLVERVNEILTAGGPGP